VNLPLALVAGGGGQPLCSGECVGHKHIQAFDPVDVAAVRLRVIESVGPPQIRRLAVFHVT